jgi:endonuclease YncB( thermonuclease family)
MWTVALLVLVIFTPHLYAAEVIEGTVSRVVDGDTVWVKIEQGTELQVRLLGIDAPEVSHPIKGGGMTPDQPYGSEAQRILAALILNQPVSVQVYRRDRRGHILGVISYGAANINLWLVHSGLAWYTRGGPNLAPLDLQRALKTAETEARQARRGLWTDPKPDPPWRFRRWMGLEQ